jgi:hypothetical protein
MRKESAVTLHCLVVPLPLPLPLPAPFPQSYASECSASDLQLGTACALEDCSIEVWQSAMVPGTDQRENMGQFSQYTDSLTEWILMGSSELHITFSVCIVDPTRTRMPPDILGMFRTFFHKHFLNIFWQFWDLFIKYIPLWGGEG